MHPILLKLGPFDFSIFGHAFHWEPTIHTFGPLVALGSFLAILYIRREGLRRGLDPEILTGFAVECLLAGVIGSRILFCLITPEAFPDRGSFGANLLAYVALWNGGLVWYGGLIPAGFFAAWRAKQLKIPVRTMTDVLAPACMLGLAVGRVGCLMAGDDHGKLVESGEHWWTLTFNNPDALVAENLKGKPLWPSQPLMSIGAFTIFAVCHALRKRLETRPAAILLVMSVLYPIHRFLIEFTRGDTVRKFFIVTETDPLTKQATNGLSTSQAISIPIVFIALVFLVRKLRRPPEGTEKAPPEVAAIPGDPTPASRPPSAPPPQGAAVAPAPAGSPHAGSPGTPQTPPEGSPPGGSPPASQAPPGLAPGAAPGENVGKQS